MTVIVKGMDMPHNCGECWELNERGDYPVCNITQEQRGYDFDIRKNKMDKCPLGEVPTPHGRLIDADIPEDVRQVHGFFNDYDLQELLEAAPTVIEAEVKE